MSLQAPSGFTFWRRALAVLLLVCIPASGAQAVSGGDFAPVCGTYPGRVLTELALHRQFQMQRVRAGYLPQSVLPQQAVDIGNIAVIPDDGTLVTATNVFDLEQRRVTFQPAGTGYRVSAGTGALDTEAMSQGVLLNPPPASNPQNIGDDGTREVSIGFSFLFYGATYTKAFINSDGNLTFRAGDTTASPRSLSRLLGGPPRIAPYFADLDPSVAGQLTYFSSSTRFVVTWNQVPDWVASGVGPRETFQVILSSDGTLQFVYSDINGPESVAGISPGGVAMVPDAVDLSMADGSGVLNGAVAELFTTTTRLDLAGVAKRFYQTHEDAYEFLAVFTNFNFDLGGAFAFELNISNRVTGLGGAFSPEIFDFAGQFGSARLESLLNMGDLSRYPADPSAVFFRGVDSPLSILAHEAGHRFLAYATYQDPEGPAHSTGMLGRQLSHWSFLFNSEASVVEGNRIRDNGNGTFTTTGAVERYSELDQYLMGLRAPEEVAASFLVKEPSPPLPPALSPTLNVSFAGRRADVMLSQIIASSGPRNPSFAVAPKRFNFAFVLVVPRGTTAPPDQVAQLERLRQAWEPFFAQATAFRGTASTALARGLRIRPNVVGLFAGAQQQARIELLATTGSGVNISLANSNPAAISVPPSVHIPAGTRSATFAISAVEPGRASIEASAPGFETSAAVVQVASLQPADGLALSITGGNNQTGPPGGTLPQPLQVALRDSNQVPYPGVSVEFVVIQGNGLLTPTSAQTDAQGNASVTLRLGETLGPVAISASIPGTSLRATFSAFAIGVAQIAPGGLFNAASFATGSTMISSGSILSIFGTNLSSTTATAEMLPLPATLGNTQVSVAGALAPLFYVSPSQINAQVPWELAAPSQVAVAVNNGFYVSQAVTLTLQTVGPGIFTRDLSGRGPGAIHHTSNPFPVSAEQPARPGDFVQIYATGLGRVVPPPSSGQAVLPPLLAFTAVPVTVTMNGAPAPVSFAGLAPGYVGLYQVNAQVPEIGPGTVEVVVIVNGVPSNPVTMEVGAR